MKSKIAYDKAFAEKGISATSKWDYIRGGQGYRAIERLLQFDHLVDGKQEITKVIHTMVIQPVVIGKSKQPKLAVYYNGHYQGLDAFGSQIESASFGEGYSLKNLSSSSIRKSGLSSAIQCPEKGTMPPRTSVASDFIDSSAAVP